MAMIDFKGNKDIKFFLRFLKNKNVYKHYIIFLEKYQKEFGLGSSETFFETVKSEMFLSHAFEWRTTILGDMFWRTLDGEWNNYTNNGLHAIMRF